MGQQDVRLNRVLLSDRVQGETSIVAHCGESSQENKGPLFHKETQVGA